MSAETTERPRVRSNRLDALAVSIMVLLCGIWGFQQAASKYALDHGIPPVLQALLRSLMAGPLLIGWFLARTGRSGVVALFAKDGTLWPGLLSGVMFAAEFILLFIGVALTSASRAVVVLYTSAFFTAAGTHFLVPGERLRPVNMAGLALAFLGVAATMGGGAGEGSVVGDVLVLGGAAAWGLTTVLVKASPALMAARPEKVLAYQLFFSIPILFLAAWMRDELRMPEAPPLAWASIIYQGVIVSFASYLTWVWLIGRYPAGRIAAFSFLTPLLGVVAAALLLGDHVTPVLLVGLACVGAGLRLVNRS